MPKNTKYLMLKILVLKISFYIYNEAFVTIPFTEKEINKCHFGNSKM